MGFVPPEMEVSRSGRWDRLGSAGAYGLAVAITVFAILSQYFLPKTFPQLLPLYSNFLGDLAVVYGIPVLAFLLLVGVRPLRAYRSRMLRATGQGLQWYALMVLLALLVTFVLVSIYFVLEPTALKLLNRPNPVIAQAKSNPWFFIAFSFVIGAIEETIFRGWIFAFWLARGSRRWFAHALWTSGVFAGVHLYYATTYGAAAPILLPTLYLTALAFAITVQRSGGNLIAVALLHGANDAISFASVISSIDSTVLHYGLVIVGLLVALYLYLRAETRKTGLHAAEGPQRTGSSAYGGPRPGAPLDDPSVPPSGPPARPPGG